MRVMLLIASLFLSEASFGHLIELSDEETNLLTINSKVVKTYSTCGEYRLISPAQLPPPYADLENKPDLLFSYAGQAIVSTNKKIPALSPQAQIYLVGESKDVTKKTFEKKLTKTLLDEVSVRVEKRFALEFDPIAELGSDETKERIKKIHTLMFQNNLAKDSDKLKMLIAFYPDVALEISAQNGPNKPLLCHVQRKADFHARVKMWSNVLVFVAVGLGISAITITSMGIAIPVVTILAGITGIACGMKDLAIGVSRFKRAEKTGEIAGLMKKLIQDSEKYSGTDLEARNKATLAQLAPNRRGLLNRLILRKYINRILITAGVITIAVNPVNFVPIAH